MQKALHPLRIEQPVCRYSKDRFVGKVILKLQWIPFDPSRDISGRVWQQKQILWHSGRFQYSEIDFQWNVFSAKLWLGGLSEYPIITQRKNNIFTHLNQSKDIYIQVGKSLTEVKFKALFCVTLLRFTLHCYFASPFCACLGESMTLDPPRLKGSHQL